MFIKIKAEGLSKRFNKFALFKGLEFSVATSGSLAVTGDNGSGKSTLLEIIAGIQKPTSGKVVYEMDSRKADLSAIQQNIGFASLKINPYGDLTALENIQFAFRYSKDNKDNKDYAERSKELLDEFNLYNDRNKRVRYFSSGMKQRLRLITAILHDPHILILDEPGSNLDISGRDAVYSYINSAKQNKIVIIATNEEGEACLCDERINLKK